MKRIILFFSFLIFLLIPCNVVHAAYMPPALPDLNTVQMPAFLEEVGMMEILNLQGISMESGQLNHLNQLVNGRTIQQSINQQYVDNAQIVSEMQSFYDSGGNLIPQEDTFTVFGSSDVANYTCVCDKQTGQILFSYDEYENMVSTLQAGNGLRNYLSFFPQSNAQQQARIRQEVNTAIGANMIVFGDHVTESEMDFLSDYEYSLTYHSNGFGYTVYVPNACSKDTVVTCYSNATYEYHGEILTGTSASYYRPIIYTNDPSEVIYSTEGQRNYLDYNPSTVYGFNFSYKSNVAEGFIPFWEGGTLDMKIPTQQEYQMYRQLSDSVVYLIPAENQGEVTNVYNYTYVTNDNIRPSPTINNSYDNRSETNYYNYPVTNTVSYPDFSTTTNTYINNIYQYYTTPNSNETIGNLNPEDLTDNIPILSNLKYRFPFSIPFDLYNLFKSFSVPRETLHFVGSIDFGHYYTWDYDLDFTPFNDVAEILRNLTLLSFIIGLAYFSYSHFFGS